MNREEGEKKHRPEEKNEKSFFLFDSIPFGVGL